MSAREAFDEMRRAGLEPLLKAAREKIREQDGVRGSVVVDLGRTEREELALLLGRPVGRSGPVRVQLLNLDEALIRTQYRVGLIAALEAGYGRITTRRQEREGAEARWMAWLTHLQGSLPGSVQGWFEGIAAGTSQSGRWCRRAYREDPDAAARAALAVGSAFDALPSEHRQYELLAVFAARVTGDPHAFDARQPAGALLIHALAERFGPADEGLRPSEGRALLLDRAGLGVDQVSSTVLTAHLAGAVLGGTTHPVVDAMAKAGGIWPITLGEVRRWQAASARGRRAFIVENPPVFEHLAGAVAQLPPSERPTLICTGGFLSAAAVRLLDLLATGGAAFLYGGDFDRNGLAIAEWLESRYGTRLRPWRMGPGDYYEACQGGGKPLSGEELEALKAASGFLSETVQAVLTKGLAAYQEKLVHRLATDLVQP